MKISIHVKTGAKNSEVKKIDDQSYVVYTTARPQEGKANKAVIELLAEFFDTSPSHIQIVSGLKSRQKIVEIY